MADGHDVECSVSYDIKLVSASLNGDTTPEIRIEKAQEAVSTIRDKLELAWTVDFPSLKRFVNESLKLTGVWSQPGGDKKALNVGSSLISWRKNKIVLSFCGTQADKLKRMFCLEFYKDLNKNDGEYISTETSIANINNLSCAGSCNELKTDVEGIKLDQVIVEREIQSNSFYTKEIKEELGKLRN